MTCISSLKLRRKNEEIHKHELYVDQNKAKKTQENKEGKYLIGQAKRICMKNTYVYSFLVCHESPT